MEHKDENSLNDWFEIRIKKEAGERTVDRFVNASSLDAAMNGVQMLLAGMAAGAGVPVLELMAGMVARIAAPAIRAEQEGP